MHILYVCGPTGKNQAYYVYTYVMTEKAYFIIFFIKEIQSIIIESISLQRRSTNEKNGIIWGGVIVFCLIDIQSQPSLLSN